MLNTDSATLKALKGFGRIDQYENFTKTGQLKRKLTKINAVCPQCYMVMPETGLLKSYEKAVEDMTVRREVWKCPDCEDTVELDMEPEGWLPRG